MADETGDRQRRHQRLRLRLRLRRLFLAMLIVVMVGAAGCRGDTEPEASGIAQTGASDDEPAPDASNDSAVTTGDASSSSGPGAITCQPHDPGYLLTFVNDSGLPQTYGGAVTLSFDDGSTSPEPMRIEFVAPGETVRVPSIIYQAERSPDANLTACTAEGVTTQEVIPDETGLVDIAACTVQANESGTLQVLVDSVNSSEHVAGTYSAHVAVRNADGERVATALINVPSSLDSFIEPGGLIQGETTLYGLPVDYDPSLTCSPVSVTKFVENPIFDPASGAQVGSLSADVAFGTGSAELTADAEALLAGAITTIADTHTGPLCVEGYADSVGDASTNLALSEDRADAVADFLRTGGLTNQIDTRGFGENLAPTDDLDDPSLRRVDIRLETCTAAG